MTQKNKIVSRFLIDLGGALTGLVLGIVFLKLFKGDMVLPLETADWIVLISTTFTAMLLSSVFHKLIGRILKPVRN